MCACKHDSISSQDFSSESLHDAVSVLFAAALCQATGSTSVLSYHAQNWDLVDRKARCMTHSLQVTSREAQRMSVVFDRGPWIERQNEHFLSTTTVKPVTGRSYLTATGCNSRLGWSGCLLWANSHCNVCMLSGSFRKSIRQNLHVYKALSGAPL